jgi:hypothetical protein
MPSFLVLGIYFLLLSSDGERAGWNHFLHGKSVEDEDDNYGVNILTDLTTWRLLFPDDGIKVEKEEVYQLRLQECWSFIGHLFSGLLPSVCLLLMVVNN